MRRYVLTALLFVVTLAVAAPGAQAVVVDMTAIGTTPSVAYNPSDQSGYVGVALVPSMRGGTYLQTAGIPTVTSIAPCSDPVLAPELTLPNTGLCSHGGSVMHSNETFALVWDPNPHHDYAASYVEQFLRDVADSSGSLGSPYAVTTQYTDAGGRAGNASLYGGGYDDPTGYPGQVCSPSGIWHYHLNTAGFYGDALNDVCLTDGQIKTELQSMIQKENLVNHIQPGYTPLLVLLTPPGVETCLDTAGHLCSANSDSAVVPAQFCSYHSQVTDPVSGQVFDYVVQPWTAQSGCDEPDAPALPTGSIDPLALAKGMGARLVSPLSQGHIAAIVNPALNGWFALDGSEINDNGCVPLNQQLDSVTVGGSGQNPYLLQREFNNGGLMVNDPFALACTPSVGLEPTFVVPSAVNEGDVVEFDGSNSPSTLLIPKAEYVWTFGDGTGAAGPSVVHSYATGGTYTVKLTVTDRGGNVRSLSQTISVLGPNGQTVSTPSPGGSTGAGTPPANPALKVQLLLMPQSLKAVLSSGIVARVSSNQTVDGFAQVSISRKAAKQAHIAAGRGPSVVIGRGTVARINNGAVSLRLHLSRAVAAKLKHLKHVTLTIRLSLVAASGDRVAIDAAGHY